MSDYEILKKNYGERFAKMCRSLFPSILEKEGELSSFMLDTFAPSKFLYDDIINGEMVDEFKNYVYSELLIETKEHKEITETPEELFEKAGYTLYKCETDADVHKFKKYWNIDEELCTFRDPNRIKTHTIFFAVKHDVDQIKRENFTSPRRQDEYGTSVISLQFTKGSSSTLSIKNRYNHTVANPDATFGNDLENIHPGLTDSFYKHYGINLVQEVNGFELKNYVMANDGKFYKYNYEINNIYYCPNNIIIQNGEVRQLDKNRYEVIDYFILDKKEKTLKTLRGLEYGGFFCESFTYHHKNIERIEVTKLESGLRQIKIYQPNEVPTLIYVDKFNKIVSYENENITEIGDYFLYYSDSVERINLPNVKKIGNYFLYNSTNINIVDLQNVEEVGSEFLLSSTDLNYINIPNLKKTGAYFIPNTENLKELNAPNLQSVGPSFLRYAKVNKINLPNLTHLQHNALTLAEPEVFYAPELKIMDDYCFCDSKYIGKFYAPKLETMGHTILYENLKIDDFFAPRIKQHRGYFSIKNKELRQKVENIILSNKEKER